ncbi:MAG TPA: hypothetical protein VHK64_05405, partial [Nocardioidaceae bacterium]|nr:hypothetical protein [Nocardioidaceae bacterium]
PNTCSGLNKTSLPFDFQLLAEGHVIAFRTFVVPVASLLNSVAAVRGALVPADVLNPFRNGAKVLPLNPTPNVDTVTCPPGGFPGDTQMGDFNQRLRVERTSDGVTPQQTKYAGAAIQPGAWHLQRDADAAGATDVLSIHPQPVPTNPFAATWDPPCVPAVVGRCYQWFAPGYAYLVTIRVYEPVATPIGNTVTIDPPSANPTPSDGRLLLESFDSLDATWP